MLRSVDPPKGPVEGRAAVAGLTEECARAFRLGITTVSLDELIVRPVGTLHNQCDLPNLRGESPDLPKCSHPADRFRKCGKAS
jgi:hypothetical protein